MLQFFMYDSLSVNGCISMPQMSINKENLRQEILDHLIATIVLQSFPPCGYGLSRQLPFISLPPLNKLFGYSVKSKLIGNSNNKLLTRY
jgi:hypothetical protein